MPPIFMPANHLLLSEVMLQSLEVFFCFFFCWSLVLEPLASKLGYVVQCTSSLQRILKRDG